MHTETIAQSPNLAEATTQWETPCQCMANSKKLMFPLDFLPMKISPAQEVPRKLVESSSDISGSFLLIRNRESGKRLT